MYKSLCGGSTAVKYGDKTLLLYYCERNVSLIINLQVILRQSCNTGCMYDTFYKSGHTITSYAQGPSPLSVFLIRIFALQQTGSK